MRMNQVKVLFFVLVVFLAISPVYALDPKTQISIGAPPYCRDFYNNHYDFDGDLYADMSFFNNGVWRIRDRTTGIIKTHFWGTAGDIPVPEAYAGGIESRLAIWRPSNGTWYIENVNTIPFGISTDKPTPADYDMDCLYDIAVFRQGVWYILKSSDSTVRIEYWGQAGDLPIPGIYRNGTDWTSVAVYRPGNSTWYALNLYDYTQMTFQFGVPGDIPFIGDFDPDGFVDFIIYRPQTSFWYIQTSYPPYTLHIIQYGTNGDVPVPANYNGTRTNIAVYRQSNGVWYVLDDFFENTTMIYFPGNPGDVPIPGILTR